MTKYLIALAGLVIVVAVVGAALWSFRYQGQHDFVIGVTAFAVGAVTFFGVIGLNRSTGGRLLFKGDHLRTAIACSLVISYLFIVCFTTFVYNEKEIGAVTQEFTRSFSNVVGITIAFYFGTSAVAQIFDKRRGEEAAADATEEKKV